MSAPSRKPWIVFAGGGTGGHLFPALGVAEALGGPASDVEISFQVTHRPIDGQILESAGYPYVVQPVRPLSLKPQTWWKFWRGWRRACASVRREFESRRPAMVIGSGGYAAGPPVRVAQRLGIPVALLNPDAVPGRSNRFLAAGADLIFVQWGTTRGAFKRGASVLETGCPVRREFLQAERGRGVTEFELDPDRKTLLVTGASQGASSINGAMIELAPSLAAGSFGPSGSWQVLHLSGGDDVDRVALAYRDASVRARVLGFTDRMPAAIAAADLIISRAGASTLAEITVVGRASVLFPYPYGRDEHQRANARVLADAGAAVLLTDHRDPSDNACELGPAVRDLLANPSRIQTMANSALQLGKPQASDEIAGHIRRWCGL